MWSSNISAAIRAWTVRVSFIGSQPVSRHAFACEHLLRTQYRSASSASSLLVCLVLTAVLSVYETTVVELLHNAVSSLSGAVAEARNGVGLTDGNEDRLLTSVVQPQPHPEAGGMQNDTFCACGEGGLDKANHL
eukprot:7391743-Prymnesium_polylepis.2